MWLDLREGWRLRAVGDLSAVPAALVTTLASGIPATVPGTVHTDLLDAGLIDDPYLDRHELDVAWIAHVDWRYETTVDWPLPEADAAETAATNLESTVDLVCHGLDTIATVEINGTVVATTQNMHRSYRFEVRDLLRPGRNEVAVTFGSALRYAHRQRELLGDVPNVGNHEPANFIRKMACNFGWDWGPTLITAGIWRPIGLHLWHGARLERVRPSVTVQEGVGRVHLDIDLAWCGDPGRPVRLTAQVDGVEAATEVPAGAASATLELTVPKVRLWWPHSLGDQPLYDVQVTLEDTAGAVRLDSWERRIGFRSIQLDTSPDEIGSAFTLVVNDVPIFVRGANWIPDDCFPHRVDAARYRHRVQQARDARVDLLRVWGGGIYESDDFYNACDELGVLVWQDFLFACAVYPEHEEFRAEVEAEARENVARLMPHPSLVLWNGNNENFLGWHHWGWKEAVGDRPWGNGYYNDLLPRIVAETDPTRPYYPGSPYSGSLERDALDDAHGCKHIWDVWNQVDYTVYRDYVPRFVSEFGWQAPPTWATLTRAIHDEPLSPDSPGLLHHQKAVDGNGKLLRGLLPHFDAPASFDDWHYLTQVNQARAIQVGIEHFRSHRGVCMGAIVWQINDCWPVTSWAAIDGDARRKPLWYAMRDAFADRLLTVQPRDGAVAVIGVNDTATAWSGDVVLRRVTFDGEVLAEATLPVQVAGRSVGTFPVPAHLANPADPTREVLVATLDGARAWWFFTEDKHLAYAEPRYRTSVERLPDGYAVTVTADTLLRDLSLFADRLAADAEVDRCLVTLLPGESVTFQVRTSATLEVADLTREPVLRTVNAAVLASRAAKEARS